MEDKLWVYKFNLVRMNTIFNPPKTDIDHVVEVMGKIHGFLVLLREYEKDVLTGSFWFRSTKPPPILPSLWLLVGAASRDGASLMLWTPVKARWYMESPFNDPKEYEDRKKRWEQSMRELLRRMEAVEKMIHDYYQNGPVA